MTTKIYDGTDWVQKVVLIDRDTENQIKQASKEWGVRPGVAIRMILKMYFNEQ